MAEKPDDRPHVLAALAPSRKHKSLRQQSLSQDARDILAYAFAAGFPASDAVPIPMNAVEVLIGDGDLDRIMLGGGFHRHAGSDSLRYFTHAEDEQWAVVFSHDCEGDIERGKALFAGYLPPKA